MLSTLRAMWWRPSPRFQEEAANRRVGGGGLEELDAASPAGIMRCGRAPARWFPRGRPRGRGLIELRAWAMLLTAMPMWSISGHGAQSLGFRVWGLATSVGLPIRWSCLEQEPFGELGDELPGSCWPVAMRVA